MKKYVAQYLEQAKTEKLTREERDRLSAAMWSDEEVYQQMCLMRDTLTIQVRDSVFLNELGGTGFRDPREVAATCAALRERRETLNWVNNQLRQYEDRKTRGSGESALQELAQIWTDALDRVKP